MNNKTDIIKDIIVSIFFIIIGIGCFFTYNPSNSKLEIGTDGLTFASYPLAVATILISLSFLYLIISAKKFFKLMNDEEKKKQKVKFFSRDYDLYFKRIGTIVLLIFYSFTIGKINFLISTSIFLFLCFILYDRRDFAFIGILSFAGSALLYGLFVFFLKLPL